MDCESSRACSELPTYPNGTQYTSPGVTLSYCNMYLAENGTEQLIYYGNGDELSSYLGNILNNATIQKAVSQDFLESISK